MKILILDVEKLGLSMAMCFQEAGHEVRIYYTKKDCMIGDGIVPIVADWRPSMDWADLIVMTTNIEIADSLQPYFDKGYPIFGANKKAAELELDRGVGQDALESARVETLPYEVFNNFDKAIEYVKKHGLRYVSKPWGGDSDKSLSYVSREPADMVVKLEHWKANGKMKGEFVLQEVMDGVEMAVGGWFGPGGWSKWWNENWEEKRLFNEGLGPNTGEAGTIMRYTKRSKLADEILIPMTDQLHELGYVGYCDVNCIIGEDGTPWPLEFTMRFGWPHMQLAMNLHKGDPAEWMLNLINGKDTLDCSEEIALGVIMAHGDYPWEKMPIEEVSDYPVKGFEPGNMEYVHFNEVKWGIAAVQSGTKIIKLGGFVTAGGYVATVVGLGKTVTSAQKAAYKLTDEISWPNDPFYRTDIGERLMKELPILQGFGFAKGVIF